MIIQAHSGWKDYQAVGEVWCFMYNFSAKNLL
jgi:hypothetical protein